jgi:hypothetical protein
MKPKRRGRRVFEPSPRDIRFACEKIQAQWSPKERRKRAGYADGRHWLPPMVELESALHESANQSRDVRYV